MKKVHLLLSLKERINAYKWDTAMYGEKKVLYNEGLNTPNWIAGTACENKIGKGKVLTKIVMGGDYFVTDGIK